MAISSELRLYYAFFDALSEVEHLVTVRSDLIEGYNDVTGVGRMIVRKIAELVSANSIVSNYDCCTMLDRLVELRLKISKQSQVLGNDIGRNCHTVETYLHWGGVLDHVMELKFDNLITLVSSEFTVDLMERLGTIAKVRHSGAISTFPPLQSVLRDISGKQ